MTHHANVDNSDCCFIRLFEKYIEICPATPHDIDAFNLQPTTKPIKDCWYTRKLLGPKTIIRLLLGCL